MIPFWNKVYGTKKFCMLGYFQIISVTFENICCVRLFMKHQVSKYLNSIYQAFMLLIVVSCCMGNQGGIKKKVNGGILERSPSSTNKGSRVVSSFWPFQSGSPSRNSVQLCLLLVSDILGVYVRNYLKWNTHALSIVSKECTVNGSTILGSAEQPISLRTLV